LRAAVLDLVARAEADGGTAQADEAQFRAALRQAVLRGRSRADELWELYRGGAPDAHGRLFARFAD
jgi:hypothetical protein